MHVKIERNKIKPICKFCFIQKSEHTCDRYHLTGSQAAARSLRRPVICAYTLCGAGCIMNGPGSGPNSFLISVQLERCHYAAGLMFSFIAANIWSASRRHLWLVTIALTRRCSLSQSVVIADGDHADRSGSRALY